MAFAEVTKTVLYKGHKIETLENPIQIVFVVDNDLEHALWSMADAKRHINGHQLKYCAVDVKHWVRENN